MKLGLHPPSPWGPDAFEPEKLQRVIDLGFTGVGPFFPEIENLGRADCGKIKRALEGMGLDMPQVGHYMTNFIHRDASVRQASIDTSKRGLERTAWMGGASLVVGGGSLNPTNDWFDHPDNHSWHSFDLTVQCLKAIVGTAEDVGVDLSMECHTYTAFDSPERVRDMIEAVGSPRLKVCLDPVNWITYATYWDNGPFIHHMFDVLGEHVDAAHAKDARQEDGLIVHLVERPAGDGNLNFQAYLTRMDQLDPDLYLLIEHTAWELVPKARDYVLAQAEKAGVSFVA